MNPRKDTAILSSKANQEMLIILDALEFLEKAWKVVMKMENFQFPVFSFSFGQSSMVPQSSEPMFFLSLGTS
jgi:hypothetical protein